MKTSLLERHARYQANRSVVRDQIAQRCTIELSADRSTAQTAQTKSPGALVSLPPIPKEVPAANRRLSESVGSLEVKP